MQPFVRSALSAEQQAPFERKTSNASILAAAGSGKTRTLVHLLAEDLARGIPANGIIAFTFTEKAADELLARVYWLAAQHLPGVDLSGMFIGTIHSWCVQYLRSRKVFVNLTAIDELHVDSLVSRFYDWLGLATTYGLQYPQAIKPFLRDLEIVYNEALAMDSVPDTIRSSVERFFDVVRNNRLITFGDMIRHATEDLCANGPVGQLQSLYVDEYQDVNPAQVELIKAMLPTAGKLTVVGDDLQCIFNWRGSDVRRILSFQQDFPDTTVFRLSTNWRARPDLVEFSNRISEQIALRDTNKIMMAGRESIAAPQIHWLTADTDDDQTAVIVSLLQQLCAAGVPWNKIAILLRSVKSWGPQIADALTQVGIPFYCPILSRGGDFAKMFVLPVLDWLCEVHPEPRTSAEEAAQQQAAEELWTSVAPWVGAKKPENAFWDGLSHWLKLVEGKDSAAYDVRGRFYDFLQICGVGIAKGDENLAMSLSIVSQIVRSVEEIHRRRFAEGRRRTPRGVLTEVRHALQRQYDDFGESMPVNQATAGVHITTVHQAKGLEWPTVIVPMLVQGRFPVNQSPHGTNFPNEVAARYGTAIEDEWRLFYVAATRAKERLFLLDPKQSNPTKRSQFLRTLSMGGAIAATASSEVSPQSFFIDPRDLAESEPAPVRIALSDLLIYLECPYQYGLRRIAGIQPSVGDELGYGLGLHELIQKRLEDGQDWGRLRMEVEALDHVHLPYMSEQREKESRKSVSKRVAQLQSLGALTGRVESEVMVEIPLGHGIVHGTVDGVKANDDGTVSIRDWKSSVHSNLLLRYQRQLQFYALALNHKGQRVSTADIVDVAASSEQNTLITYLVDTGPDAIASIRQVLEIALERITRQNFEPQPSPTACSSCDMLRLCAERYDEETESG